ncbi:MAG: hypothetical protein QM640_11840 [Niabella sp.]
MITFLTFKTLKSTINKNQIAVGLTTIIAGGVFLYLFVFRNTQDVADAISHIYISFAASGVGPVFILIGLFYVLVRSESLNPEEMSSKERTLYWIMVATGLIIGLSTAFWLQHYVKEAGYSRPF